MTLWSSIPKCVGPGPPSMENDYEETKRQNVLVLTTGRPISLLLFFLLPNRHSRPLSDYSPKKAVCDRWAMPGDVHFISCICAGFTEGKYQKCDYSAIEEADHKECAILRPITPARGDGALCEAVDRLAGCCTTGCPSSRFRGTASGCPVGEGLSQTQRPT